MLAGLVTTSGRVLASKEVPTSGDTYMESLTALVQDMRDQADGASMPVRGIGVGTTGLVDHRDGRLIRAMNLGLEDIPIRDVLQERFGEPTYVDNDMRAGTVGELMFGAGRQHNDFVFLNAGTGIAAGMVFGGQLYRGASNTVGEVGHTSIDQHGPACQCGLVGCVETSIVAHREGKVAPTATLVRAQTEPPSPTFGLIALTLIHLVNVLNPSAIVLAGGMLTRNQGAVTWISDAVRRQALPDAIRGLRSISLSKHAEQIGLIGAAALALVETTPRSERRP